MPIDFQSEKNRTTYAMREADKSWYDAFQAICSVKGLTIADIGCGGGIYSKAMSHLGAAQVIGIDSSEAMLKGAVEHCTGTNGIEFHIGDASKTGLDDESVHIVFERALIHHLPELHSCFSEAFRILKPGGLLIIQDRTPEDIHIKGSQEHIRGYFFDLYPRLLDMELKRRPRTDQVKTALKLAGFESTFEQAFWETRRIYSDSSELAADLKQRTGRSILHELTDEELQNLIVFIQEQISQTVSIVEKDRWTIWVARKPIV